MCQFHKLFVAESSNQFTEDQLKVFYLAMGQLESQLGADLDSVSSLHWDESDRFPRYGGGDYLLASGYGALLNKMARGLHITLNTEVTRIDYTEDSVKVYTDNPDIFTAAKVVVTVPVSLLPDIAFTPELPPYKVGALNAIGIGHCEKIILKFSSRFWPKDSPTFATLPSFKDRNFLNHFKDLTYLKMEGPFVLETAVGGAAVDWLRSHTDCQVVEACLKRLATMFPARHVPSPQGWCITRWYHQPGSCMSRSFLRPDTTADLYDHLADHIDRRVYFAGEATYRPHPGTTTGAYLSGIRAAKDIYESYLPSEDELDGFKCFDNLRMEL